MLACNKFSESILHTACRSGTPMVVQYLLSHAELLPPGFADLVATSSGDAGNAASGITDMSNRSNDTADSLSSTATRENKSKSIKMDWNCLVDDGGRSPMHDACWRAEPLFSVISVLLDHNPRLLLFQDLRGDTPLHYVRSQHWGQWCAFLVLMQDKYWPARPTGHDQTKQQKQQLTTEESTALDSVQG